MPRTQHTPALPLLFAAAFAAACSPQVDPDYSGEPLATIRGAVMSEQTATAADVAVLWFISEGDECAGPMIGCEVGIGGNTDEASLQCIANCSTSQDECRADVQAIYGACVEACGWAHYFAILWDLCVRGGAGERVSVAGEFPAAFTLDLFQPPPDNALLFDESGLRVAYGWFIVADPEVETIEIDLTDNAPPSAIIGGTGSHVLIYAADPIPEDSAWGRYFGGSLELGYHILDVIPGTTCDDSWPEGGLACRETENTYTLSEDDLATEIGVTLAPFGSIEWPGL